ncbi:MAG: sigma factor-like helix-turn-helix DNA-binding protein, partial [Prevotella sp.]|nr:sigma factor-like helix-turn-helix DNA-binding protein [Prevotella sp.]
NALNERERNVISAFYGLGEPELTMDEIGKKFGLTRERVRQIRERALRRLRQNTQNKALRAYLGK